MGKALLRSLWLALFAFGCSGRELSASAPPMPAACGDGGACPNPEDACTSGATRPLGSTCAADEYCAYTEGALCGAADATATCRKRFSTCPSPVQLVCGCDGKTYVNACDAARSGTGIHANGPCAN